MTTLSNQIHFCFIVTSVNKKCENRYFYLITTTLIPDKSLLRHLSLQKFSFDT